MSAPTRRPTITQEVIRNNTRYHVSVSFNPETAEVMEIWAYGPKPGSEAYWLLQETCWDLSHRLQEGDTPSDIAAQVMRYEDGSPASVRGEMIDVLVATEQEYRHA